MNCLEIEILERRTRTDGGAAAGVLVLGDRVVAAETARAGIDNVHRARQRLLVRRVDELNSAQWGKHTSPSTTPVSVLKTEATVGLF